MLNVNVSSDNVLSFQDFIDSSVQFEIGSAIEMPNAGRYTSQRWIVRSKVQSEDGKMFLYSAKKVKENGYLN